MAFDQAAANTRRPAPNVNSGSRAASLNRSPERIEDLPALKQRVFRLLNSSTAIESLSAQLGSNSDTAQLRQRIFRECTTAANLVTDIDGGLRRLRVSIMSTGNATAQRDLEKLAEDYDVLKGRTVECVRQSQARQRQFAPQSGGGEDAVGRPQQSQLRETNGASSSHVMIEMQQFSDADDAIAEERSREATAIAKDAVELRDMMRDMSGMVREQGESVQIIEDHVDATRSEVIEANRELTQAAEFQASYRRKLCIAAMCCLAVLAAVLIPLIIHFFPQGGGPPPI